MSQARYIPDLEAETARLQHVGDVNRQQLERLRALEEENTRLQHELTHLRAIRVRLAPFLKLGHVRDVERRLGTR